MMYVRDARVLFLCVTCMCVMYVNYVSTSVKKLRRVVRSYFRREFFSGDNCPDGNILWGSSPGRNSPRPNMKVQRPSHLITL